MCWIFLRKATSFLFLLLVPASTTTSQAFQPTWISSQNVKAALSSLHLSKSRGDGETTTRRRFLCDAAGAALAIAVIAGDHNAVFNRLVPEQPRENEFVAWAAGGVTSSVSTDPDPVIFDLIPQFLTVDDVPTNYFDDRRYIYGFVERVIDGDTIRVRHIPGFGFGRKVPQPLDKRGISDETLSIRIYGVDTPETGKNKRKASQPFGKEAQAFTTDLVYHKMVKVTFLRKDQYKRAVAKVETVEEGMSSSFLPGYGPKDLSMELAKAGLAELYTGGGAEYFGRKQELEQAIAKAKQQRKGIWSLDERVSAADYKRAEREGIPITSSSAKDNNTMKHQANSMVIASTFDTQTTSSYPAGWRLQLFRRR
ncbi:hypothetical protein ACA910_000845 [Epithemia clementina (nom. ined.)]